MSVDYESNEDIALFREYLRIPSVHPNPNYGPCVDLLKREADALKLPVNVFFPVNEQNPILVITWKGSKPHLPAILLNSHMDVVPVFPEQWKYDPFGAEMDNEGKIYARGTQDMKSVGMQHLCAVKAMKKSGVQLARTVHLSFVPDEEMGGRYGMRPFVQTDSFKHLNIGFSLDEGLASADEEIPVFYAERSVWRVIFKISGNAGHGSLLLKNTVGEKLHYILNKMMDMRQAEVKRLENNPELRIGDVTTINLTRVNGGVQSNVIPPSIEACFDVRLSLDVDQSAFEAKLQNWCEDVGGGVELEYEQKRPRVAPTPIDQSNPFYMAFKRVTDECGLKISTQIFTGGTDSRYIRELGIPAIGFSPMNNTPVLLHDHNEYLGADTFLRGIEIFKKIITAVANV